MNVPPTEVFDPNVKTLAYKEDGRVLDAFKNGQIWQLFGVPSVMLRSTVRQFGNELHGFGSRCRTGTQSNQKVRLAGAEPSPETQ